MTTRCFLDMDGVLVNFSAASLATHGRPTLYADHPELRGPKAWDIPKHIGLTPQKFWAAFESREWWASIPPHAEARGIYELVEEAYGVENLFVVTSPSDNAGCVAGKMDWMRQHFPALVNRMVFARKKWFLAGKNAVLLDDYGPHVGEWRFHGGLAFLVPRPWNAAYERETVLLEDLRSWLSVRPREVIPQI